MKSHKRRYLVREIIEKGQPKQGQEKQYFYAVKELMRTIERYEKQELKKTKEILGL